MVAHYCKSQHLGGSRTTSFRLAWVYDMVGPCLSKAGGEKDRRGWDPHVSLKEVVYRN